MESAPSSSLPHEPHVDLTALPTVKRDWSVRNGTVRFLTTALIEATPQDSNETRQRLNEAMGDIRAESRGGMDDVYRENMDLRVSSSAQTGEGTLLARVTAAESFQSRNGCLTAVILTIFDTAVSDCQGQKERKFHVCSNECLFANFSRFVGVSRTKSRKSSWSRVVSCFYP